MKKTDTLIRVAIALMADPFSEHYGYPLGKAARVRSGALYPILGRLLAEGWLIDSWEDANDARLAGRPPRRMYRLTDIGRRELGMLTDEARFDPRYAWMAGVTG